MAEALRVPRLFHEQGYPTLRSALAKSPFSHTIERAKPLPVAPRETPQRRGFDLVAQPIAFQCPSCGEWLSIPYPEDYNGHPAPCPDCYRLIVAPRIA